MLRVPGSRFLLTGACFLANLIGKCAPKKFPAASRARKCLKRVAVRATGLFNNEPEAQFRGFDITKNIKTSNVLKTGRRGSYGTFE